MNDMGTALDEIGGAIFDLSRLVEGFREAAAILDKGDTQEGMLLRAAISAFDLCRKDLDRLHTEADEVYLRERDCTLTPVD